MNENELIVHVVGIGEDFALCGHKMNWDEDEVIFLINNPSMSEPDLCEPCRLEWKRIRLQDNESPFPTAPIFFEVEEDPGRSEIANNPIGSHHPDCQCERCRIGDMSWLWLHHPGEY